MGFRKKRGVNWWETQTHTNTCIYFTLYTLLVFEFLLFTWEISAQCLECVLDTVEEHLGYNKRDSFQKCLLLEKLQKYFKQPWLVQCVEHGPPFLSGPAWVAGQIPSWGLVIGNWLTFLLHIYVSLPFSPSLPHL